MKASAPPVPAPTVSLMVNGTAYTLTAAKVGKVTFGFRLTKTDGTFYTVGPSGLCDCPDARYRNRVCKHAKTLAGMDLIDIPEQE